MGGVADIHGGASTFPGLQFRAIEFPSQSGEVCCRNAIVGRIPARKVPHIGIVCLASKANASMNDGEKAADSCRSSLGGAPDHHMRMKSLAIIAALALSTAIA